MGREHEERGGEARTFGDLGDIAVRRALTHIHPMHNRQYWAPTPEGDGLYEVLYQYALRRKSGLYAIGRNRVGKSDALEAAVARLRADFPEMAFFIISAERIERDSKRTFSKFLLKNVKYDMEALKPRADPALTFARFLMAECAQRGGTSVMLLIDEAQLFSVADYRYLLEFWNELKRNGYLLCTALLGQKELRQLQTLTQELDHTAVVARFFVKLYMFRGVRTPEILRALFRCYDTTLRFPAGSEWPYSRFFARARFDAGWRLEHETDLAWQALLRVSKPYKKPADVSTDGFVMGGIVEAVHGFLTEAMTLDAKPWKSGVSLWERHIQLGSVEELL